MTTESLMSPTILGSDPHSSRLQLPQLSFGKYQVALQVSKRGCLSGCIILGVLGADPPRLSPFLHDQGQIFLSIRIIFMLGVLTATKIMSPCEPTRDRPMIKDWHDVCARVGHCSVAKPKG